MLDKVYILFTQSRVLAAYSNNDDAQVAKAQFNSVNDSDSEVATVECFVPLMGKASNVLNVIIDEEVRHERELSAAAAAK